MGSGAQRGGSVTLREPRDDSRSGFLICINQRVNAVAAPKKEKGRLVSHVCLHLFGQSRSGVLFPSLVV